MRGCFLGFGDFSLRNFLLVGRIGLIWVWKVCLFFVFRLWSLIVEGRKWYWMLGCFILGLFRINFFVFRWVVVLFFVWLINYCRFILIIIWGNFYWVLYSVMGFLYFCWIYILRWFCKFLLIFGKCWIIGILSLRRLFVLLILESIRSCGELIVLL